jgi:hypothetical protein
LAEEGPLAGEDLRGYCVVPCVVFHDSCVITYAWSSNLLLLANAYLAVQCLILAMTSMAPWFRMQADGLIPPLIKQDALLPKLVR